MRFAALVLGTGALTACHDSPHVSGRACIVLDLRFPRQCLGHQEVGGVSVELVGTQLHATTKDDGSFRIETPTALATATLRIAADGRRPSLVLVDDASDADPIVPLITTAVWTSYITNIAGADNPARAAVHASYEAPGAIIAGATVSSATAVYFNQGEAFVWATTPPGDQTVAVLALDAEPGTSNLAIRKLDDTQLTYEGLPLEAGATTWVDLGTP